MTTQLQSLFTSRVGDLPPIPLVTDVAFPLPGGLAGGAAAFNGDIVTDIYARPHNPTVRNLAEAVARIDQGTGAVGYACGQAAIRNVVQLLCARDTEILLSRHVFGGTVALETAIFARYGVTFRFFDPADPQSIAGQVNDRTRLILAEGVANPGSEVADFEGLRDAATHYNLPLVIDNTTSPLLLDAKALGADAIAYSATKYLNGHGDAPAGIIVDTGRFAWKDDDRYPTLSAPVGALPSVADRFNGNALAAGLQSALTVDGSILAPEKAHTIYGNLATLPARLAAHVENTKLAATLLSGHDAVERVHYAGLESDPSHARAQKYLPHGVAGPFMVTFKGGYDAAGRFFEGLGDDFMHAVNIGDARKNLVSHPATTTHRQLSPSHRDTLGIRDGSLRLSISARNPERTLAAITCGLKAI